MLYWAAVYFVIALIAALVGFGLTHGGIVVDISKILFFIFLVIFAVTLILLLLRSREMTLKELRDHIQCGEIYQVAGGSTAGATFPVFYFNGDGAHVTIEDPVRRAEFKTLLARGLNTWADQPTWLTAMHDQLREFDDGHTRKSR